MNRFLSFLLILTLAPAALAETKMNVLLVFIDDMGLTDLGCYGSKFYETPHLDRLAQDGMKFTQAYSACTVCSPTRAALLTGKYPARLHLTDWIAGHARPSAKLRTPDWTKELKAGETTIAEILREKGYATAQFGKWHLGKGQPATAQGFDLSVADNGLGQPASYLSPYKNPQLPDGPPGEELTDRLTREAAQWMEKNKERPWFVYLPHFAVHTPLGGKPEVIARFQAKADPGAPQKNAKYAALVAAVDDSIGALRAKLAELKLAERTVIIFTSDNGGLLPITANLGLRAGKGSAYEGGVRVPAIVVWPGVTKPGSTCATPVITMDWCATLAAAAGSNVPGDGVNVLPLLRGETIPPRPVYWHYPHYHPGGATPYSAVRDGDWRLVHFYEDDRAELYDLRDDPAEQTDLAEKQPERAAKLRAQLQAWREKVGAQPPLPNPNFEAGKKAAPAKADAVKP